jgi:NAD(P)-dependent dehydrogenase (short-subunit alcohol dehydrogenase family)
LQQDEAFKEKYISRTPMKRMCKPSDLVQTYLFLSSNDSSYITGQDFIVDGGFSLN